MPKTRLEKEKITESFKNCMKEAKSVLFVHFFGLTVPEVNELRRLCEKRNVKYLVAKKTLMMRAFKDLSLPLDFKMFPADVASIFSFDDEVAGAKLMMEFAKKHERLQCFSGWLGEQVLSLSEIKQLSTIPSRDELLPQFVRTLKSPLTNLAYVLRWNIQSFVGVLRKIQQAKI